MPLQPARAASPSPASHRPTSRRLLLTALGASLLAVPALAYQAADAASTAETGAGTTADTKADAGLDDPAKKDIAMRLVSSAENSSLEWEEQYDYVEDIGDGRGYTGGIIGFCSGTSDMLALVELYTARVADNPLAGCLPALRAVNGTDSHEGLDPGFPDAWREAAATAAFRTAQRDERDRVYFDPAVARAKEDGLGALGQFVYYDAMVMHGPGTDALSFGGIRDRGPSSRRPPRRRAATRPVSCTPSSTPGCGRWSRRTPTATSAASRRPSGSSWRRATSLWSRR